MIPANSITWKLSALFVVCLLFVAGLQAWTFHVFWKSRHPGPRPGPGHHRRGHPRAPFEPEDPRRGPSPEPDSWIQPKQSRDPLHRPPPPRGPPGPPPIGHFLLTRLAWILTTACLAGVLGVRWITSRLQVLEEGVKSLDAGDLSIRLEPGSEDEFGRLIAGFNAMAAKLEASQQALEAQDLTRRELIADVAHELSTPLTGMLLNLEVLEEKLADPNPDQARLLETAIQSGQNLAARVQDLLTLARAELDQLPIEMTLVDLKDHLEATLGSHRVAATQAGVQLELQAPGDPLEIRADPQRLRQVWDNLLVNARKAMVEGGRIKVRLEREESWAKVEFEDEGPGMEASEIPDLFTRFRRGKSSRSGGTGLGLSIVQRFVEVHGGRCEIESEVSKGTLFRVWLPLDLPGHPAEVEHANHRGHEDQGANMRNAG